MDDVPEHTRENIQVGVASESVREAATRRGGRTGRRSLPGLVVSSIQAAAIGLGTRVLEEQVVGWKAKGRGEARTQALGWEQAQKQSAKKYVNDASVREKPDEETVSENGERVAVGLGAEKATTEKVPGG